MTDFDDFLCNYRGLLSLGRCFGILNYSLDPFRGNHSPGGECGRACMRRALECTQGAASVSISDSWFWYGQPRVSFFYFSFYFSEQRIVLRPTVYRFFEPQIAIASSLPVFACAQI